MEPADPPFWYLARSEHAVWLRVGGWMLCPVVVVAVGPYLVLALVAHALGCGLPDVVDWPIGGLAVGAGRFALVGRRGWASVRVDGPATAVLRPGWRVWFEGTEEDWLRFDPMAQ